MTMAMGDPGFGKLLLFAIPLCVLSTFAVVCCALWSVIPGRKVQARIVSKRLAETRIGRWDTPVLIRHITVAFDGHEHELIADEWDYNHINVGDEGILDYRKDEFRSFTKQTGSRN